MTVNNIRRQRAVLILYRDLNSLIDVALLHVGKCTITDEAAMPIQVWQSNELRQSRAHESST